MTPGQYQRLTTIKAALDALVAECGAQPFDAPTPAPGAQAAPAPPRSPADDAAFGRGRSQVDCDHPKAKRESTSGFGAGPSTWRCGVCGKVQSEG